MAVEVDVCGGMLVGITAVLLLDYASALSCKLVL